MKKELVCLSVTRQAWDQPIGVGDGTALLETGGVATCLWSLDECQVGSRRVEW